MLKARSNRPIVTKSQAKIPSARESARACPPTGGDQTMTNRTAASGAPRKTKGIRRPQRVRVRSESWPTRGSLIAFHTPYAMAYARLMSQTSSRTTLV